MSLKVYNRSIRDMEEEILRPSTYILTSRSNHFVVKEIPESYQYWLKIPEDKFRKVQNIMEMFLSSTILVDDIQDNSLHRRRIPTAHCVFGVPLAINASFHTLGITLEKILDLGHPMAITLFIPTLVDIFRGQGADAYWRENLICINEDEYKKCAEKKSSAFFMIPMMLMQLFSDNKKDYSKFIIMFGVYYVIRDDYCNLVEPEKLDGLKRNKEIQALHEPSFCEDLTDGKFSWPVLHALNSPEANIIIYMLKQRTRDEGMKHYFLSVLQRLGSLQYTLDVLNEYDRDLRAELERLGGNPHLEAILDDLKSWAE